MRILKFGPSRYCCCVTASAKVLRVVSGLFIQLFLCFRSLIKNYAIKDSFSHSFTLSRVGLWKFAKLIQTRNTYEGLRNRHEFYRHPVSLLRKETCLLTRARESKISFKASKNWWTKACSLLNTSYNVVTKQCIFVTWIKAFPAFLAITEVIDSSKWKQNKNHKETRRFIS